jgi:hypothetical protein|tara:strand:+ start:276 stop:650 length:375 start_codon:yes stop_codon:yes gene_type:complete
MGKNSLHDLAAGAFGQNGSVLLNSTATVTANNGKHFHAITFITNTVFANNADGLVSNNSQEFTIETTTSSSVGKSMSFNSTNGGQLGAGGSATGTVTFPAGITVYGRWSQIKLASGTAVAYIES